MSEHYTRFELAMMDCRTALAADPIAWRRFEQFGGAR